MAGSLFDQLKKAGLVDEQKAKKLKKDKYQQTKQQKGKKGVQQPTEAAKLAAEAAQQKAEKDRQLNLAQQQAQAEKAKQAELRQLIQTHQIKGYHGDIAYNFADGTQVKTLHVNPNIHKKLSADQLRIARFESDYVLVSRDAATKISQRDESVLIPIVKDDHEGLSQADKDYYAQFEIPDDLIW
ncbi:MAG: DUF2058 domain-containing protein [Piscirickettsiaceae bacterium CG_4_9_14_3_um_filter_43_564]|nr:DUF2058 domain-containing protein [Thiomicrospira sp.]OIP95917.1 MAG: hypothetical protein AUK56_03750 [Thiomicrospira sp. CG2_30_44_34]PIQ04070.1 MAG: hypothetical protein COW74_05660 [Piscirickettsiaceae bacterium CG18_big_fil_WC_8_21_14_2_50_44_103]PIU39014.1 MAG: DUF2058 domain-containing protein [Piscirickettsiaceae bacterium CG07_land_8_20_14_0_80_44_28]PIW56891.1 MAG: DUF2058 domain-containing protein [Piscirickettsiaceae bacterium CG12_big_fil_rev_8_21_14_0_65_44_934]PIW78243.1 MAG: